MILRAGDDACVSLQAKYPETEETVLIEGAKPGAEAVIFDEINYHAIQAAAKKTVGSDGSTRVDASTWKHILCSIVFGKLSDELAEIRCTYGT